MTCPEECFKTSSSIRSRYFPGASLSYSAPGRSVDSVLYLDLCSRRAPARLAHSFAICRGSASQPRNWRAGVIWLLQSALATLLLVLLWQPAIVIAELKPQQNIIAILLDDSRSMGTSEDGSTREQQAVKALQGGVLDELNKNFQTRIYRLDSHLTRVPRSEELARFAPGPATHIGDSLKQLVTAGNIGPADRRGHPAQRRVRQFGRHRPRYDFRSPKPPHTRAYGWLWSGANTQRH